MKKLVAPFIVLLVLLYACTPKEKVADFTDLETITKDDTFRAGIKSGQFIKLSDGYTYYELANPEADTMVVMVHGFSVPSYIWDSTYTAAVKHGYGALRYDTYGRGNSDNPDVAYNVTLYSRQLKELLDTLQVKTSIHLLGLSDGGRTISTFASQYPERIKSLIYVDAAGFNVMPTTPSVEVSVSEEEITAFKKERYPTMASGQMTDFYDSIPFRGWDGKYKTLLSYKGFVRVLLSTNKNRTDLEADHRKIAASGIPVFILWGKYDTVVKLDEAQPVIKDRIPNAQLFVIPDAGHLPQMEQTKLFNSILFDQIISGKK
ncbi:MAG TPA: alpha/beta hydrolase [Cyclobacteriaceae bacterium]